MVNLLKQPSVRAAATLSIACILTTAWILDLKWNLPWAQLFMPPQSLPVEGLIVQSTMLPRMLMALLAGGCLAAGTILMQQAMRNPLASDSTLAVSSGAQTALVLAMVFAPGLLVYGTPMVAFAGSACALAIVLWLSAKRSFQPLTVILAGLVTALYLGSVSGILTLFHSEALSSVMLWGSGSLVQDSWHDSLQLLWRAALCGAAMLLLAKPLEIMSLSDTQASALGIPVKKTRFAALSIAALLNANIVGMVGMLGFVGLAAATITRYVGIRTLKAGILMSFLFGALILLLTDNTLVLLKHYYQIDLPTGSVTAFIGAPLLLWLMARAPAKPAIQTGIVSGNARPALSKTLKWLPALLAATAALALFAGKNGSTWHWLFDLNLIELRYPRMLTAAAAGIMLSLVGVMLQRLTQNPMASPEVLGISSGTALGVMLAILVFNIEAGSSRFWLAGTCSALFTLCLIMFFNRKNGLVPEKVLLTGIAVAALSDSALRIWTASGDPRIQQMMIWLSGSTYQATAALSWTMLITALLSLLCSLFLDRWLGLLGLGNEVAQSAGVRVSAARLALVLISAILTACATLLVGPLSFVGLLAPHLAGLLGARRPRQQLLYSSLIGSIVMIGSDWLGRQIMFPYEIPAGLMATLIGGGYFLLLMRKI